MLLASCTKGFRYFKARFLGFPF
uniref:Uncharacterized protein n=1 Tax=Rhizophora mucronata TaxID=61149 RepID=A0A2P2Q9J7_RHIMU